MKLNTILKDEFNNEFKIVEIKENTKINGKIYFCELIKQAEDFLYYVGYKENGKKIYPFSENKISKFKCKQ